MRTIFEHEGKFGIECDGGIEYEADFDTKEEAEAIAKAHNDGAFSYEEASNKIDRADCYFLRVS